MILQRLEELVAPGFRFTALHLAPEPMSREQWMGAALGGYHIISFAYQSMDIDVFGDTAVIHARYSQIANFDAVYGVMTGADTRPDTDDMNTTRPAGAPA